MVLWRKTMRKVHVVGLAQNLRLKNFYFKIRHVLKFFIVQSDKRKKIYFKIWRVVFFPVKICRVVVFFNSIQNLTRNEFFLYKIMLFKKARNLQNMSFSWSKMNQNVIFWKRKIFQNLRCRKIFDSKSNALYFFSNQNLTRCKTF